MKHENSVLSDELLNVKLPSFGAFVLRHAGRIEELWVVGFYACVEEFCHCWKCSDMNL